MGFTVYDYRLDTDSVFVTSEVRAKFMHMEPGEIAESHSHELGVSVFLVLEGKVEFDIEGEVEELGPGQMCAALANEKHIMRCASNTPATVYLSVTPHIQPTHTTFKKGGAKVLQRYVGDEVPNTPIEELTGKHVNAAQDLAQAAQANAVSQQHAAAKLKEAIARNDENAASEARDAMWQALYDVYRKAFAQASAWNQLIEHIPTEANWPEGMTPPECS
jgi:quercetin dioxygenase-like cupin family protein